MKKKLLCMAIFVIYLNYHGQVGIGTPFPKSTLDITAKNATGTSTNTDGLLIPRLDRQRALSMASVEPSTLIYVNNISTGTASGQASNIDAVGFYYFDGMRSKWTKLTTSISNSTTANNGLTKTGDNFQLGGTLIKNTDIVTAGYNTTFSGSGNIGIGTSAPDTKLTVFTPDDSFGIHHTNGTIDLKSYIGKGKAMLGTTTTHDLSFVSNNVVRATITKDGKVGIGTDSPTEKLEVNSGNTNTSGLKFTNMTSNTPAAISSAVLGVDQNGNVVVSGLRIPSNVLYARRTGTSVKTGNNVFHILWFEATDHINNEYITRIDNGTFMVKKAGLYSFDVWAKFSGIPAENLTDRGIALRLTLGTSAIQAHGYRWNSGMGDTPLVTTVKLSTGDVFKVDTVTYKSGTYTQLPGAYISVMYTAIP